MHTLLGIMHVRICVDWPHIKKFFEHDAIDERRTLEIKQLLERMMAKYAPNEDKEDNYDVPSILLMTTATTL